MVYLYLVIRNNHSNSFK